MYLLFITLDIIILMWANPFPGPLEKVGPENQKFLGPEMATSEVSAIWAPKRWDSQGQRLPVVQIMDLPPIKIINSIHHINKGTLVILCTWVLLQLCRYWYWWRGVERLPFQGPKNYRFVGSTPPNGPRNGFAIWGGAVWSVFTSYCSPRYKCLYFIYALEANIMHLAVSSWFLINFVGPPRVPGPPRVW